MGTLGIQHGPRQLQTAYNYAEELTALADQLGSLDLKIEAASCKTASNFWFAKYEECVRLVDWIEDVYTLEQHGKHAFQYTQDPKSSSLSFKAWSLWLLGYPEQARATAERNIAHSRTVHHAYSLGFGLIFSAMLFMMMEDEERVVPLEDESWPLSESNGYPIWMAGHYFLQGWLMVRHGEAREALPQYEQGLAIWDGSADVCGSRDRCASCCRRRSHAANSNADGRSSERFGSFKRENGEVFYQPETLRVEGELILAEARERAATGGTTDETIPHLSPEARAEALFRESLTLAAQFQSKTFTLKTAISLHALLGSGARSVESRDILERAYQAFTEGFDVPLLQRAKKMLDDVPTVESHPVNNA